MTTDTTTLPDTTAAYRALRERVGELVRNSGTGELLAIAPATPEWRVHDVVAHMVGLTTDVLAGRMEGITTDAWTAAQVDPRRDLPTEALIDEWAANAEVFEPMIPSFGPLAGQALTDASTHEHDIRHALDRPGARDSDAVHIGSAWLGDRVGEFNAQAGHGALRIETDLWTQTYGEGDTATTLRCRRSSSCADPRGDEVGPRSTHGNGPEPHGRS
jgi:Mycothiol maleylpyruvate isomerase N-terminal domain.